MPGNKNKPAKEPPFRPPQHEVEAFARCILPAIRAFYDTERLLSQALDMASHIRAGIPCNPWITQSPDGDAPAAGAKLTLEPNDKSERIPNCVDCRMVRI